LSFRQGPMGTLSMERRPAGAPSTRCP